MVALLVVSSVAITPGLSAAHSLVYSTAANRSAPVSLSGVTAVNFYLDDP